MYKYSIREHGVWCFVCAIFAPKVSLCKLVSLTFTVLMSEKGTDKIIIISLIIVPFFYRNPLRSLALKLAIIMIAGCVR